MIVWRWVRAMLGTSALMPAHRQPKAQHPRADAALAKAEAALAKRMRLDDEIDRVERLIYDNRTHRTGQ
jgi:hypothetical protein